MARHSLGRIPSSQATRRCISGSGFPCSTSSRVTTTSNSSASPRTLSTRQACSRWDWVARAVEKPLSPDAAEQGYAARIGVLLDQFRVAEHLLVDAEPDPDVCLPRPVHPKLRHTRPGRVLKPEAAHQVDGDLLARETHQASEARDHFSFGEAGAQLGGGAGVGEL